MLADSVLTSSRRTYDQPALYVYRTRPPEPEGSKFTITISEALQQIMPISAPPFTSRSQNVIKRNLRALRQLSAKPLLRNI